MVVLVLVPFELVASSKFSNGGSPGEPAKTKSPESKIPSAKQQKCKMLQSNTGYSICRPAGPQLGSKYKPVI